MPNFAGERGTGLVTRVSSDPAPPADSLYGGVVDGLRFDAVRIHYDHEAWAARVSERWPEGSDVHRSYHARMQGGPAAFAVANAAREGVALPADPARETAPASAPAPVASEESTTAPVSAAASAPAAIEL